MRRCKHCFRVIRKEGNRGEFCGRYCALGFASETLRLFPQEVYVECFDAPTEMNKAVIDEETVCVRVFLNEIKNLVHSS